MKRATLLAIVDLDGNHFEQFRKRDQLPFNARPPGIASRGREYSLDDVFRIRVMLELLAHDVPGRTGLGPTPASKAVSAIGVTIDDAARAEEDLWTGTVAFRGVTRAGLKEAGGLHFTGRLGDLSQEISRQNAVWAEAYRTCGAARVFLANASGAARHVLSRAAELGIEVETGQRRGRATGAAGSFRRKFPIPRPPQCVAVPEAW